MRCRFEVLIRCANCRKDGVVETKWLSGAASTEAVVRSAWGQISRFTCAECQGTTGRISGVIEMKQSPAKTMSPTAADAIAVKVFAIIAASEVMTSRFLQVTGIEQETVRKAARTPAFLKGVLDYVLADMDVLADVVEAVAVPAETILVASRNLSKPQPQVAEPEPKLNGVRAGDLPAKGAVVARRSMFRDRREGEAA